MIRLNRIKLFLLGFAMIITCYFVRQVTFIMSSGRVEGRVSHVTNEGHFTRLSYPIVTFFVDSEPYQFIAESNMPMTKGERVEVIYKKDDPSEARIYTFSGFWVKSLIYFLIPLVVWAAFSLSYLDKGELLSFHVWGPKKNGRSGSSAQLPRDWNENKRIEE